MDVHELIAIEEIKQLKARYFRLMDQGRWEEFAELFSEDCEQNWQAAPGAELAGGKGRAAVVDYIRTSLAGMRSTHHGHMPEIEITSPTTAVGIWALFDHCTAAHRIRPGISSVARVAAASRSHSDCCKPDQRAGSQMDAAGKPDP